MRLKLFWVSCLFLFILGLVACNDQNDILATYQGGKVIRKDVSQAQQIFKQGTTANIKWQKRYVRNLVVIRTLSARAEKEGLLKDSASETVLNIVKENTYRHVLLQKKRDELEKQPETIYRARHILLKLNPFKPGKDGNTERLSSREMAALVEETRQTINKVRDDLVAGKVTFTAAAEKHSEDTNSAQKGGDLGFFPVDTMVPQFAIALRQLAGANKGSYMQVTQDTELLEEPKRRSEVVSDIDKYYFVEIIDSTTDEDYSRVSFTKDRGAKLKGYLKKSILTGLKTAKKISHPVRSHYGWHIIEFIEKRRVTRDEYIDLLASTQFKDDKQPQKSATMAVRQYWDRFKKEAEDKYIDTIFKKYRLDRDNLPELPDDWQKEEVLFEQNGIAVKKQELENYLDIILSQRGLVLEEGVEKESWYRRLFQQLLENRIFFTEGKKQNIDQEELFQFRYKIERMGYMSSLYRQKKWLQDLEPAEEEIKRDYEQLVEQHRARKTRPPSYKKQRPILRSRIYKNKIRTTTRTRENELLKRISFKLVDENFN